MRCAVRPEVSAEEYKVYFRRPKVRRKVKRGYRRRERHAARRDLLDLLTHPP